MLEFSAADASLLEPARRLTGVVRDEARGLPGLGRLQADSPALLELLDEIDCAEPPDATCQARLAGKVKADRVVWGIVDLPPNGVSLTIHLWADNHDRSATIEPRGTVEEQRAQVREALVGLGADYLRGRVRLVGDLIGEVLVDGVSVGRLVGGSTEVEIFPGPHTLVVRTSTGQTAPMSIDVRPNDFATIDVPPLAPSATTRRGIGVRTALGIGALVTGGVAGGVAFAASLRVLQDQDALDPYLADPQIIPPGADACDDGEAGEYPNVKGAERPSVITFCRDAESFQLVEAVMWPVSGALLVTGIVLVVVGDPPPVAVSASVGPSGATLEVSGRF